MDYLSPTFFCKASTRIWERGKKVVETLHINPNERICEQHQRRYGQQGMLNFSQRSYPLSPFKSVFPRGRWNRLKYSNEEWLSQHYASFSTFLSFSKHPLQPFCSSADFTQTKLEQVFLQLGRVRGLINNAHSPRNSALRPCSAICQMRISIDDCFAMDFPGIVCSVKNGNARSSRVSRFAMQNTRTFPQHEPGFCMFIKT